MTTIHLGDCLNGCDTCKEYHHQEMTGVCNECQTPLI
jgi:hypothetical protein